MNTAPPSAPDPRELRSPHLGFSLIVIGVMGAGVLAAWTGNLLNLGAQDPQKAQLGASSSAEVGEPHDLGVVFGEAATDAQVSAVADDWKANPLLYLVLVFGDGERDGLGVATSVGALTSDTSLDRARTFACGYLGDPGVVSVAVDSEPCPHVEVAVAFDERTSRAHQSAVRRAFDASPLFDAVTVGTLGSTELGWNELTATGPTDDAREMCAFARDYLDDPTVVMVESSGTNECPDL